MSPDSLRRAKAYPYNIPARSYVVAEGSPQELAPCAPALDVEGCRAVLAVGSNQSPEQLLRKFPGSGWGAIPVIRARLSDFDIVYSPHVSSYGSIPATLFPSPGTTVTLFVNWLTPAQETHMHETEVATGNYHFGRLDGIEVQMEMGRALSSVYVYCSSRGSLVHNAAPIALAEVGATGRKWPSLNQEDIQAHVRDRLSPGLAIDQFIREAIADHSTRRTRTEALMADSLPFNFFGFTLIEV
jgi:hypothetical protein